MVNPLIAFLAQSASALAPSFSGFLGRTPPLVLPHRFELVPGDLFVTVFAHEINSRAGLLPCWSYVSKGMEEHGQREIVFTLRRPPKKAGQELPRDLFEVFKAIHAFAEEGRLVPPGGFTVWNPEITFLGRTGRWGLLYQPAEALKGVEIPRRALAAVLIRDDETDIVQLGLFYRIATSLGAVNRYYPFTPWSDPDRRAVVTREQLGRSVLSKVITMRIPGIKVRIPSRVEGPSSVPWGRWEDFKTTFQGTFSLRIGSEALPLLRSNLKTLGEGRPVALLTDPDLAGSCRLYWESGSGRTIGIMPQTGPGRWTTGGFIILCHGEGLADRGSIIEDGFGMVLCPDSWKKLESSIERGVPLTIPGIAGSLSLDVEYLPSNVALNCHETGIVLLNSEEQMAERGSDAQSLSEHIARLMAVTSDLLGEQAEEGASGMLIAVGVKPGRKARVWCEAAGGKLSVFFLSFLEKELAKVPPIDVINGPIAFIVKVALWDRQAAGFPELPTEWTVAAAAEGKVFSIPDGLFKLIWPD